jgi:two-component system, chemotaxis family, chemotaxis protein CheY
MAYTVLIADDSALIRKSIGMALELGRLPTDSVFTAENGLTALKILDQEYVDLVFLDLNMPVKDGFGVLADLRSRRETRHLPVIVVSTEVNRENPLLREYGIQAFIAKPFKPEEICNAARQAMGGKVPT